MNDLLEIKTFGGLDIRRNGKAVSGLASRKVEALLVYLACTDRPQPREVLADFFWGELPQRQAMTNLRVALASLRKQLKPFLIITRESLALDQNTAIRLDLARLEAGLDPFRSAEKIRDQTMAEQVEQALDLYHGEFLRGFFLRKASRFDDWMVRERERMQLTVIDALQDLIAFKIEIEAYKAGITLATRLLELEPMLEVGHRQLIRLLAYSGQRAAALAQYATCLSILDRELEVAPEAETTALYEAIKSGELTQAEKPKSTFPIRPARPPAFLAEDAQPAVERSVFVAREKELARLFGYLENALARQGQVAFVVGEAGSGKTSLVQEFARQAMDEYPDLLVGMGSCSAHSGVGDPLLPFREVLRMLTGEVESQWAGGMLDQPHAKRIWNQSVEIINKVFERGPDLVGRLLDSVELLRKLDSSEYRDPSTIHFLDSKSQSDDFTSAGHNNAPLINQFTSTIQAISEDNPLLVILDDLQWIDQMSIELLFYLGHRLKGRKILVVCAYRPGDLAQLDPSILQLQDAVSELKRRFGATLVDLDLTNNEGRRQFINQLLDSAPNKLDDKFRSTLVSHTAGHALFTVEILRAMQERLDIILDDGGFWIENKVIDWSSIPARVEGIIEARINRLSPSQFALLQAAAVEGEIFTAQVIAQMLKKDESEVLRILTSELAHRHGFILEDNVQFINDMSLYQFRFRHSLFQTYMYSTISDVTRIIMHGQVGRVLEDHFKGQLSLVAGKLVHHFDQADLVQKEIKYAVLAGDQARKLGASIEAIQFYERALEKIKNENQYFDNIHPIHIFEKIGDINRINLARHENALVYYDECLSLAKTNRQKASAIRKIASAHHLLGDIDIAEKKYYQALRLLNRKQPYQEKIGIHYGLASIYLEKNEILEAEQQAFHALELAEQLEDKMGSANAYRSLGAIAYEKGDMQASSDYGNLSLELYRELGDLTRVVQATNNVGESQFLTGSVSTALETLENGLAISSKVGLTREEIFLLNSMAQLLIEIGDWNEAKNYINRAIPLAYQSGEATSLILVHWTLGRSLIGIREFHDAHSHLQQALDYSRDNQINRFLSWIYLALALLSTYEKKFDTSEEYLNLIRSSLHETTSSWLVSKYHRYHGIFEFSKENFDSAIDSFLVFSKVSDHTIPPIEVAKTKYFLGLSLAARNRVHDLARASRELKSARAQFSTLGANYYEEIVADAIADLSIGFN